ncbi:MAG: DUF4097 family beta strand repeat protein [Anaerolineae bacterium]|nr:DUF4097 family beta strand repeat protein [Anaerolineae bacterium]
MIEVVREYSIEEVQQIEIKLARGDVQGATAAISTVRVQARIHDTSDEALEITLQGGQLFAGHRDMNGEIVNGLRSFPAIDIELIVPAAADPLTIVRTGKGDVRLDGIGSVAAVKTGKGDVSVSRADGAVQIDSGAGDVALKGCGGEAIVHTGAGDIALSGCRAGVTANTGRGDINIDGAVGDLSIRTGSGDINASHWHGGENGSTTGDGAINTGSGDISVSNVAAGSLRMQTGRGDCVLGQVRLETLDVNSGSGDLVLSGDPGIGRWQAKTGKGDIVLKLPGTASARVEAATRRGDIRSDLPQVKVARPGPASERGGRTIIVLGDEPRAEVMLESGKGDIVIRATGPVPVTVGQPVAVAEVVAPKVPELAPSQPVPVSQTVPSRDVTMGILESLSRGEINVDEAETLLKALA